MFSRNLGKSSLGGEVHALGDKVHHTSFFRDFYGPLEGLNPGVLGLEDCESLSTHLKQYPTGPRAGRVGKCVLGSGHR